jgi:hypothetical protein
MAVAGCGFSAHESMIRSKRPEYLKNYSGGPIASLSQNEIEEAIDFGKANKHNQNVINYAFMFAKDSSRLMEVNPRTIYALICTNYYLIADYAATQTRNYENIDMDYVNFLAHLPTFRIEVLEKMGDIFYPIMVNSKFVLLKDGNRIAESQDNQLYKGQNPYAVSHFSGQVDWQQSMDEAVNKSIKMANQIAQAYQDDAKVNIAAVAPIYSNIKNLYDYKDIDLNSKYELVVIYPDREIRLPIDFSNIK